MSIQINDRLFWPGGKLKAFTLSYDDGVEQDRKLVEIFNKYQVKSTFNLNSGLAGQESKMNIGEKTVSHNKITETEICSLYKGHEIATHGLYHSDMSCMDVVRCCYEVLTCRREMENLLGYPVTGYAYAFGLVDDTILQAVRDCGITYARTVQSTHVFDIPQDFLTWNPTCHHNDDKLFMLVDHFLNKETAFSFQSPARLFNVWGHSYEFDQYDNWDRIENFLEKISGHDDVWYATNQEIQMYVAAYHQLVFSVDSNTVFNPTALSVWLGGIMTDESIEIKQGQVVKLLSPVNI